ncbi:uncharacterized protein [Mytilus edulis]|uniref:uncharacterized protein n=1 Tax=Mytilus edulis TaxID=6550 RepID=UPI0039EEE652
MEQNVNYSFIPDRTDHMTKYKCMDIIKPSIMTEVGLIIKYAPTLSINYTTGTIKCKCDGVPAIYTIYRLDQTSQYGQLVRSVNLNNEAFTLSREALWYQLNGRYVCFVSNGIPDLNGTVLQTTSINVKYEGPPVFTKENRNVNIGEVGKSITLQFYLYSYPKVGYIYIEKLGLNRSQNITMDHYDILEATLHYTEYENKIGIQGYETLVEYTILDIGDFQKYRITAKNRLGASDYHFEIINNENLQWSEKKMTYVWILSSLASVIFVYTTIVQICICVRHEKKKAREHTFVPENQHYLTYDDIGSVNESQSFNNTENENGRHTHLRESSISTVDNQQLVIVSSENNLSDCTLPQLEVTDVQSELKCVPSKETKISNMIVSGISTAEATDVQSALTYVPSNDTHICNTGASGISSADLPSIEKVRSSNQSHSETDDDSIPDLNSQLCNNFGNELSSTSVGDENEDPYETVL